MTGHAGVLREVVECKPHVALQIAELALTAHASLCRYVDRRYRKGQDKTECHRNHQLDE